MHVLYPKNKDTMSLDGLFLFFGLQRHTYRIIYQNGTMVANSCITMTVVQNPENYFITRAGITFVLSFIPVYAHI